MQKPSQKDDLPQVPSGEAETQALIRDTRAVTVLEVEYAASLDFGGISTDTVRVTWQHQRRSTALPEPLEGIEK